MRKFLDRMIQTTKDPGCWHEVKRLLNFTSAADIEDSIFAGLQTEIDKRLEVQVSSATKSYTARLSVVHTSPASTLRFSRFSVPGTLLAIYMKAQENGGTQLDVMLNCVVEKLTADDEGVVRAMKTSRGTVSW